MKTPDQFMEKMANRLTLAAVGVLVCIAFLMALNASDTVEKAPVRLIPSLPPTERPFDP